MSNQPLYKKVGEELINETITLGLSLLIIILGVNYFSFKYAWVKVVSSLAQPIAETNFYNEVTIMLSAIGKTFPFKYFFGDYNLLYGIMIGIVILVIGISLKVMTKPSKEKFIVDMGRNIYVPAMIGFVSILILQIIIALGGVKTIADQLASPFFVWKTYGEMFLIGVVTLVLGAVAKLIAKAQQAVKIKIIANTLLYGSYISIVFYLVIRILSSGIILNSPAGNFFKVFILSGDVSVLVIIFCIYMFTLGIEIKRYGQLLAHHKEAAIHLGALPNLPPPKGL